MPGPSKKDATTELRHVQADGSVLFRGSNLKVRLTVLKAGVVLVTAYGEVLDDQDAGVEAALLAELEAEMNRSGSLTLFADLRGSPRVPAASRERLAQWTKRHRGPLLPFHVLVQSKLMEMAASIVSLLIGERAFEVYTKPAAFLAVIKTVAPKLTELPTAPER